MHTANPAPVRHTALDDLQGLGLGIFLCGLGLHVLTHVGLITGQIAGLAVILSHLSGWSFGAVFFLINLPFYLLAWQRLGPAFTVKSFVSVTLLSLITEVLPLGFSIGQIETWLGALVFGALTGIGLLAMFRHGASLGGFGILALMVQDRTGFRAGYVQLAIDAVLFSAALALFPAQVVAWSVLGAAVLNLIIAINHRRDRYVAS